MLWFISLWDGLVVTWSRQISSGCLVDSFGLLGGSIGLMCSIIPYAVPHFSLGWIGGYLVGSDIFGLFGRFSWVVSWFNRSYVFYYTICGASLRSGLDWWLLDRVRYVRIVWSVVLGC